MKLHYRLGWIIALGLARLLWRFRRSGSERIPKRGPVVIASNHISNWDPILVGLGCPREVHFMAKEELFRNPLLGWLIRAYNALPVKRGVLDRRALRLASDVLVAGEALLMFPEGTRSTDGRLGEAKPGVGFLACTAGAPIVPAYITGSEALGRAFSTRTPVRVAYGEPISAGAGDSNDAYRSLAERVMNEIRRLKKEVEET